MSQLKADLMAARAVIEKPEGWTKGWFARDAAGEGAPAAGPEATCWCALGAVRKALGYNCDNYEQLIGRLDDAENTLMKAMPSSLDDVPSFNDDPSTTHADILALFDRAIAASDLAAT